MVTSTHSFYRVRLNSGRVLGPIGGERILALLRKNRIQGSELAKTLPLGEWKPILDHPELADLFVDQLQGKPAGSTSDTAGLGPKRGPAPSRTAPVFPTIPAIQTGASTFVLEAPVASPLAVIPAPPSASSQLLSEDLTK